MLLKKIKRGEMQKAIDIKLTNIEMQIINGIVKILVFLQNYVLSGIIITKNIFQ